MNKLEKLRLRRDKINAQIREITEAEKAARDARVVANQARALQCAFDANGGEQAFLDNCTGGRVLDAEPGGGCEFMSYWRPYVYECELLGVLPNIQLVSCKKPGKHVVDGRNACAAHKKERFRSQPELLEMATYQQTYTRHRIFERERAVERMEAADR